MLPISGRTGAFLKTCKFHENQCLVLKHNSPTKVGRRVGGRGERGEGKERLPQDPVLLKSAPRINGCTCQISANQNIPEGRMLSRQLNCYIFPNKCGRKEIPSKLLIFFRIQLGVKQRYISSENLLKYSEARKPGKEK